MRFLSPGKLDAILFSAGLMLLWAIALPTFICWDLTDEYRPIGLSLVGLCGLLGMLMGMASIAGSPSRYTRAECWIAWLSCPVMGLVLFWSARTMRIWDRQLAPLFPRAILDLEWLGWRGASVLMAAFVLGAVIVFVTQWIANRIVKRLVNKGVTRSGGMISVAVVLFVLASGRNLWNPWMHANSWRMGDIVLPGLKWMIPFVLVSAVVAPALMLSRTRSFWTRFALASCWLGGLLAAGVSYVAARNPNPRLPSVAVGCFCLGVLIPLILLSPKSVEATVEAGNPPLPDPQTRKKVCWLGAGLSVVLVLAAIVLVSRYDVKSLVTCPTNRWSTARQMQSFRTDSGTDFYGDVDGLNGSFHIRFSDQSDPNYLDRFQSFPMATYFKCKGMNTRINCSALQTIVFGRGVSLQDSVVTGQQISDLAQGGARLNCKDVKLIPSDSISQVPGNTLLLGLDGYQAGQISEFLTGVEAASPLSNLYVSNSEINLDDWKSLVRVAQTCSVSLHQSLLPEDLMERWQLKEGESISSMSLGQLKNQQSLNLKFAQNTDAIVSFLPAAEVQGNGLEDKIYQDYWGMLLLAGHRIESVQDRYETLALPRTQGTPSFRKSFLELARQNHWLVSESVSGSLESFYFPSYVPKLVADLRQFPEVKRISFDDSWVSSNRNYFRDAGLVSLDDLKTFTQLESLYLPVRVEPRDLAFLSKMPNLRELAISPRREAVNRPGFEQCLSLESLTLLNSPSRQVLLELVKIPTLKNLTIVDFGYQFSNPQSQAALRKRFQGVEVEFVPVHLYRPEPPDEFREHRKRCRERIRQKHSEGLDTISKD